MADKKKQPVLIIVAAAAIAIAAALLWRSFGGDDREQRVQLVYYYDLDQKKLFVESNAKLPPITAPSGGEGVLAHVFTCNACTEGEQFIGFLETYTAEARQRIEALSTAERAQLGPAYFQIVDQGMRVRAVDGEQWLPAAARQRLMESVAVRCGGSPDRMLQTCSPPSSPQPSP